MTPPSALLDLSGADLARRFAQGHPLQAQDLAGFEYRGVSLGLPAFVERLSWKTFVKAFQRAPDGRLRGWNVRLEQTGVEGPLRPKLKGGLPWCFGWFSVAQEGPRVLLDYGAGGNPPWDPTGLLRDPLVALEPGSAELLLGCSQVQLGPWRLQTPSWFLLRRERPLSWIAAPGSPPVPA